MKKISVFIIFSFVIASIFFVKNFVFAASDWAISGADINISNQFSYTVNYTISGALDTGNIINVCGHFSGGVVGCIPSYTAIGGETGVHIFNGEIDSFNFGGFPDGPVVFSGWVASGAITITGSEVSYAVSMDRIAPTFAGVTSGAQYNTDQSITFSDDNLSGATLNGVAYTSGDTISTSGVKIFIVTDLVGNSAGATFTIDETAPTFAGVTSGAYYSGNKSITFSDTNLSGATLNGVAYTSGDTISTDGVKVFIVTDLAGNSTGATFTIDTTVPTFAGVTSGAYYSGNKSITFSDTNLSGATLDGVAYTSGEVISSTGVKIFIVTDLAGNSTGATFTIDTTSPSFAGVTSGSYYSGSVTLTFSDTATLNGSGISSGDVISSGGSYTLLVTDLAGNSTGATFTIDTTDPTTPNLLLSGYLNTGTANLLRSASTDTNMSGYIWQLSTGSDFATIYSSGSVTATGTTITGLTDTTYFYQVYAFDKAGNTGSRNSGSFIVDTIAPTLSGAAAVTNLTSQTPSYSFTSDETGTITYSGSCSSATTTAISGTQTIVFNSLSNATYTNCQFKVTDTAANASSGLTIPTFTVNYTAPSGGGGGGGSISKDVCLSGDLSPSLYDRTCEASGSSTGALHGRQRYTGSIIGSTYPTEWNNAYLYARGIGITTMNSIQQADMEGGLIRAHMAKMMVNYAITVLKRAPNTGALCIFDDVVHQSAEMKFYIKLACQLGLMGVGITDFNPNGGVTRAEFGTVLSRALYGNTYNTTGSMYYTNHLNALKANNIITNTNPWLKEIRGYVMLMLMRAGE